VRSNPSIELVARLAFMAVSRRCSTTLYVSEARNGRLRAIQSAEFHSSLVLVTRDNVKGAEALTEVSSPPP
jgi:hypothetical protein